MYFNKGVFSPGIYTRSSTADSTSISKPLEVLSSVSKWPQIRDVGFSGWYGSFNIVYHLVHGICKIPRSPSIFSCDLSYTDFMFSSSPKIQTHLMTVWNFGGGGSERCCCLLGRQCRQQALALHITLMLLLTWRSNDGNLIKFVSFYLSGLSVVVYTPYVAHNPPLKLASVRTSAESPPYL